MISVARSIVPPVVAPAPTVEWISSMKRIGIGRLLSAVITALKRSSKSPRKRVPASSAAVSSAEDLGPLQHFGDVVLEQPRREPFGQRGLADAGVADEYRVVLPAAAEDLERPLELGQPADQRIEAAVLRARGQVHRVRAKRIARGRAAAVADAGVGVTLGRLRVGRAAGRRGRDLADPVRDVFEHVEPRHALRGEELRRVRLGLLERGREHVARLDFLASRALHVQDRRLQHAAERHRLVGLFLLAALELLDVLVEILVEVAAELGQIGAARGEDPLAVRVVRQRVEQVLQRQVRMMPGGRLAVRHGENHLERGTEHALFGFHCRA